MSTDPFFPPTPEVQHLPTLFRRVQQGEIRVPAFQRGFVWKEAQIVQLLESVYRGFPIGSLLFWNVKERLLRIEQTAAFPFPQLPEKYPFKFLLDGLQRLSTLYGVFHWPDVAIPGPYNVVFDLDIEEFRHYENGLPLSRAIHLSSLFSPKDFLAAQRSLTFESDSELLIERAIRLHSVFQEYMVPTVTIENRSVPDVVAMFERINSTGTKLNAVDFMRAVTWSEDFDLNTEINSLSNTLEEEQFEVPVETLVKALAVVAGTAPTPSAMLELRRRSASELQESMRIVRDVIQKARHFLEEHLAIRSYEYLPYEGQFLVLLRFFQLHGDKDSIKLDKLEQWIWTTSFNEELRGKPDHYVVRMLDRVEALVSGDMRALSGRLTLTAADLTERRFIRAKALSAAFACLFAKHQARSLLTGEVIPPESYMQEFSTKNFQGLFPIRELSGAFDREYQSDKMFANTFLFSEGDLLATKGVFGRELIEMSMKNHPTLFSEIIRSQFVVPDMLLFLREGDVGSFLHTRASLITSLAKRVAGDEFS
jgi:hypothetical protein